MKDVKTIFSKIVSEREIVCKKCGQKCTVLKDSKSEYCGDCKFEYFMKSCETNFKS